MLIGAYQETVELAGMIELKSMAMLALSSSDMEPFEGIRRLLQRLASSDRQDI